MPDQMNGGMGRFRVAVIIMLTSGRAAPLPSMSRERLEKKEKQEQEEEARDGR